MLNFIMLMVIIFILSVGLVCIATAIFYKLGMFTNNVNNTRDSE